MAPRTLDMTLNLKAKKCGKWPRWSSFRYIKRINNNMGRVAYRCWHGSVMITLREKEGLREKCKTVI